MSEAAAGRDIVKPGLSNQGNLNFNGNGIIKTGGNGEITFSTHLDIVQGGGPFCNTNLYFSSEPFVP